ncbi:MAG: 4-hydroxybenzoyl-CoA reductase subunit beta [Alphaproteobacteria bacterium]|nr:4-hydroxybenzoyl-CoA reductase subunit beta [Alphaproteobacteria bacterium]
MTAPVPEFRLARPSSIEEAIALKRAHAASHFLAGGTDMLVNLRHGISAPDVLIDLSGITGLRKMETREDGVTIGAGTTISDLTGDATIAGSYRALAQAAEAIAGPGHRVMGTVGGNLCLDTRCIYYNQSEWWRSANAYCLKHRGDTCRVAPKGARCHAAYTGDLAPALLVLNAEVEIADAGGTRRIPLSELYVEDGRAHLALKDGQLVTAVHLPKAPPPSLYEKVRQRGSIDYPLAGVAAALSQADGRVGALRIALTGTNSRPFLLDGTERFAGRALDEQALQEIDKLVQKQVQPMRTTVAPANYRRIAAGAVARRIVSRLLSADGR